MAFIWIGWFLGAEYSRRLTAPAGLVGLAVGAMFIAAVTPVLFAGAGITTQPAFQATKGLHGSTLFTLALPVSRLRLLAVRAGLGWLVLAGTIGIMCSGMWMLFPVLRAETTVPEMLEYAAALLACASGFYSISVLLATVLDDLWRIYGSMIAVGALWLLFNETPLPASVNLFRAMSEGSPLIAHTMPWNAIGLSLGLATILFFAALKVVQAREY
jgi:hypothetical protein